MTPVETDAFNLFRAEIGRLALENNVPAVARQEGSEAVVTIAKGTYGQLVVGNDILGKADPDQTIGPRNVASIVFTAMLNHAKASSKGNE